MNDFTTILEQLSLGKDLSSRQTEYAISEIIGGKINKSRIAAFLFGMSCKGETIEELTTLVHVMRRASVTVNVDIENAVDLCGTGGDHSGTFNISTAAMFVVAGANVPVLKHGNTGVSSQSGSFDVLKSLGAQPDLENNKVEACFRETGMGFMFAPLFHPAMAQVMPARKELGIKTFFNIMGPLLNPAGVKRQIIGAYNLETARKMIRILRNLDSEFVYAVHAEDGLDEFTTTSQTGVFQLMNGYIEENNSFHPRLLGISLSKPEELKGGYPDENATIIRTVLENRATESQREIVLLNAAFAIHASGLYSDIHEAMYEARESLESGSAREAMQRFSECTSDLKASS